MKIKGKVAFIAGAASAMGRATALLFAREGAAVVIADNDKVEGQRLAADIYEEGGTSLFLLTDFSQPESIERSIGQVIDRLGAIHIIFTNVGGFPHDAIQHTSAEVFSSTLKADIGGTWLCCKHGIAALTQAGGGVIINAAGATARMGHDSLITHTVATGAIAAMTRSLGIELSDYGIRVNAIAWGAAEAKPDPDDAARLALFLACGDSAGITGRIFSMDGDTGHPSAIMPTPVAFDEIEANIRIARRYPL